MLVRYCVKILIVRFSSNVCHIKRASYKMDNNILQVNSRFNQLVINDSLNQANVHSPSPVEGVRLFIGPSLGGDHLYHSWSMEPVFAVINSLSSDPLYKDYLLNSGVKPLYAIYKLPFSDFVYYVNRMRTIDNRVYGPGAVLSYLTSFIPRSYLDRFASDEPYLADSEDLPTEKAVRQSIHSKRVRARFIRNRKALMLAASEAATEYLGKYQLYDKHSLVLLPLSCGISRTLMCKMSFLDYSKFVDLNSKRLKNQFKKDFRSWCIKVKDRRFNAWSRFYKALTNKRYLPTTHDLAVSEGPVDDLKTVLEWEYLDLFTKCMALLRSFYIKDHLLIPVHVLSIVTDPKFSYLCGLMQEIISFDDLSRGDAVSESPDAEIPLLEKLIKIIGMAATSSLLISCGVGVQNMLLVFKEVLNGIKQTKNLVFAVFEFVKLLRERLLLAYNEGDFTLLFKGSYSAWRKEVKELTTSSVLDDFKKSLVCLSYEEQVDSMDKLIKEGERYNKGGYFNVEDKYLFNKLIKKRDKTVALSKRTATRKAPMGVILFGSPGVGKTYFADLLNLYVRQAQETLPVKSGDVYEIPLADKHWNNIGSPNVLLLNDINGTGHDKHSVQNIPELMRRIADTPALWTPQADLDEKFDNCVEPVVCVLTTNSTKLDFRSLGEDWSKLERRFKTCIKVTYPEGHDARITVADDKQLLKSCVYQFYEVKDDHGLFCLDHKAIGEPVIGIQNVAPMIRTLVHNHVHKDKPEPVDILCPLGLSPDLHDGILCPDCPYAKPLIIPPTFYGPSAPIVATSEAIFRDDFDFYKFFNYCQLFFVTYIVFKLYFACMFVRDRFVDLCLNFDVTAKALVSTMNYFKVTTRLTVDSFKDTFWYVMRLLFQIYLLYRLYNWYSDKPLKAVAEVVSNPIDLDGAENLLPLHMRQEPLEALPLSGVPKFDYSSYNPVKLSKGLYDFSLEQLKLKVNNNTMRIIYKDHTYGCAFALNSHVIVTTKHTYDKLLSICGLDEVLTLAHYPNVAKSDIRYYFNLQRVKLYPVKDLAFIKLPGPSSAVDLTRHFISAKRPKSVNCVIDGVPGVALYRDVDVIQTNVSVFQGSTYSYPKHGAGMCGLPLLIIDDSKPTFHGVVAGIHIAGYENPLRTGGVAMVIDDMLVQQVLDHFKVVPVTVVVPPHVSGYSEMCGPRMQLLTKTKGDITPLIPISPIGTFGPMKKSQGKSAVRKTDMHDLVIEDFVEKKVIPRMDRNGELVDGDWLSPSVHKVRSYTFPPKRFDSEVLDMAVRDFLRDMPPTDKLHPLTLKQAVNGIERDPLMKGINLNSSMGSLRFYFNDKREVVDRVEINKDLVGAIVHINKTHENNHIFSHYQRWELKDEPVTVKKDKLLKYRYFMISELAPLIDNRRILAPLLRYVYSNMEHFEASGAFNPASTQFDKLYRRFRQFTHLHCFDLKHMDTSHRTLLSEWLADMFCGIAHHCGYSQPEINKVRLIILETVWSVIECRNDLYFSDEGMGSGLYVTFIYNCFAISLIFRYAFFLKVKDPNRNFRKENVLITGGDDSAHSSDLDFMNGPYMAEVFSDLGYDLTTARKNQDFIEEHTEWEEFVFLKRTPRYVPELDYYIGVLDLDSILKNMAFVIPSKDQTLAEQMMQKCDAAARELALHEQHIFDKYINILQTIHPEVQYFPRSYYLDRYYNSDLYERTQDSLPVDSGLATSEGPFEIPSHPCESEGDQVFLTYCLLFLLYFYNQFSLGLKFLSLGIVVHMYYMNNQECKPFGQYLVFDFFVGSSFYFLCRRTFDGKELLEIGLDALYGPTVTLFLGLYRLVNDKVNMFYQVLFSLIHLAIFYHPHSYSLYSLYYGFRVFSLVLKSIMISHPVSFEAFVQQCRDRGCGVNLLSYVYEERRRMERNGEVEPANRIFRF